jgi:Flp pilus assembly pilin Flp
MTHRRFSGRSILRDRRGVAAVEFAFVAPVLIVVLLAGFDIARYAQTVRRVEAVATSIGQMLSVSTSGQVAVADLRFYEDATMVLLPQVLQDSYQRQISWGNDINITVSSINFSGSDPNYVGTVGWSAGSNLRPCKTPMTATSDVSPPTAQTLPIDVFGPGSLIVVDIVFNFRPSVSSRILQSMPIVRSYYVQPRYVAALSYAGTAGATVNQC